MLLLSSINKRLLLLWLIFSAVLLTFFLLQILNGKYAGIESQAWSWIFVQLLPGLLALLGATLFQLNRGKYLLRWVFWALLGLTSFYLLFVLVSLAGISSGSAGQSLELGLSGSYRYLLPLQALVLAVYGVLFLKKDNLFQPNEAKMRDYAQSILTSAPEHSDRRAALEFFIAADMPAMLHFLEGKIRAKNPPGKIPTEVLMLQNKLATLKRDTDFGKLSTEEARKEYALICFAALGLVEEI